MKFWGLLDITLQIAQVEKLSHYNESIICLKKFNLKNSALFKKYVTIKNAYFCIKKSAFQKSRKSNMLL